MPLQDVAIEETKVVGVCVEKVEVAAQRPHTHATHTRHTHDTHTHTHKRMRAHTLSNAHTHYQTHTMAPHAQKHGRLPSVARISSTR